MATRWTSKHTGQKIDDTIDYVCNPNLLDNWYFGNPVNQRGKTEQYGGGYFIDRWIAQEGKFALTNNGLTLGVDGVNSWISHRLNVDVEGQIITVSALTSDGKLYAGTGRLTKQSGVSVPFDGGGYVSCSYAAGISMFVFELARYDITLPITILAVKLELGKQQTLAHQDENGNWVLNEIPDYGEQLRRCQRYDYIIGRADYSAPVGLGTAYDDTSVVAVIELPEMMRANPTVSITGVINLRFSAFQNVVSNHVSNYGFSGDKVQLYFSGLSGLTQGQSCDIYVPQGSKIEFNSNL